MRYWLITNTTYGTWLPGDKRGSVTSVRDRREGEPYSPARREHDQPGQSYEQPIGGLNRSAMGLLKGAPVLLLLQQAELLCTQFQETATYRGWSLLAVSVMKNHFHLVVAVDDDPEPRKILVDFKAYGSRALNRSFSKPASGILVDYERIQAKATRRKSSFSSNKLRSLQTNQAIGHVVS